MSDEDSYLGAYHQYPSSGVIPHANDHGGLLWIELQAQRLISQAVNANGEPETAPEVDVFRFIAPDSIMEQIGHTWDSYESLYSRASQTLAAAQKLKSEGGVVVNGVRQAVKALGEPGNIKQTLSNMAGAAGQTGVAQTRVDTPLSYQNSNRRKYDFEFHLVDEGDTYNNVVFPIKLLEKYSCPEWKGGISIDLPYVFKIRSFPNYNGKTLINIDYSALTTVTATYNGPYRNGFPTHATVALAFEELQPLYRQSFGEIAQVTTGTVE